MRRTQRGGEGDGGVYLVYSFEFGLRVVGHPPTARPYLPAMSIPALENDAPTVPTHGGPRARPSHLLQKLQPAASPRLLLPQFDVGEPHLQPPVWQRWLHICQPDQPRSARSLSDMVSQQPFWPGPYPVRPQAQPSDRNVMPSILFICPGTR